MNTILLAIVLTGAIEPPMNAGVIVPKGGFKPRNRLVFGSSVEEVGGPAQQFAGYLQTTLPETDRGKWWLILHVDTLSQRESSQLLRDFDQHPGLAAIKSWCKTWVIQKGGTVAADARIQANMAGKFSMLPVILLVPNPDDPVFGRDSTDTQGQKLGWRYAYVQESYGLDAGKLARTLAEAIRREYAVRGRPCPGPYCPVNPQPDQPGPSPAPNTPDPRLPRPFPTPDAPNLPIGPQPYPPQPHGPLGPVSPGQKAWQFLSDWWWAIALVAFGLWIAKRKGWLDKLLEQKKEAKKE